ncbi:hypothetical protein PVIIG_06296 [Plasmodium vivax India VII]|uniref:VIR protein n=1 Tax=Plasmodium vivax India VII TaxID=1077284 RepID=A0A0J9S477_PLAVI|nr:hypothetical protein PVIIG_06296 [Plasmodium vivax India VII]
MIKFKRIIKNIVFKDIFISFNILVNSRYFNYHVYSNIKTDMNPSYSIPNDDSSYISDTAKKLSTNHPYKLKGFIKLLIKYKFFLNRHHAFSRNDNDNCCRYINYWINDQVRYGDYNVNEYNFKYLKEYVENLADDNTPHRCYRFIEYINYDLFLKLQKLYQLYDKYYDALENLKNKRTSFCSDFDNLVRLYNDFINYTYKEKTELYSKRLKDLESRIEETKEKHKRSCTGFNFYLSTLQIDPPPQVESSVQVHTKAQETLSPEPLDSTRSTSSDTGDRVQKPLVDEEASGFEKVQEDLSPTGLPKGRGPLSPPESSGDREDSSSTEFSRVREFLQVPENLRVQRFSQGLNETELDDHSGRTLHQELSTYGRALFQVPNEQQESEGFLKQARSTISGIIGEVDPIPVVGVSGGMGVLFLLFKVFNVLKL